MHLAGGGGEGVEKNIIHTHKHTHICVLSLYHMIYGS